MSRQSIDTQSPREGKIRGATGLAGAATAATLALITAPDSAQGCGGGEFGWFGGWDFFWDWEIEFAVPTALERANFLLGSGETSTVQSEQAGLFPRPSQAQAVSHTSGDAPGWQSFESFELDEDSLLDEFRWQGFCWSPGNPELNPSPPCADRWTVSIWADDRGRPGLQLYSETRSAEEVRQTWLGDAPHGPRGENVSFHDFQFDLSDPLLVARGVRHWVSVTAENDSATETVFVWASGASCGCELDQRSFAMPPLGDGSLMRNLADGSENWLARERAMSLIGTPAADRDGDGMSDSWETANGLDPDFADGTDDLDGDGLVNLREFALRTDPGNTDTDGDGLSDGVESLSGEYSGWSLTGTDPRDPDTDGDGLSDGEEDPWNGAQSNPNLADTDGDGYDDQLEILNGFDPNSAEDSPMPVVLGTGTGALPIGGLVADALASDGSASGSSRPAVLTASTTTDPEAPGSARHAFDGQLGSRDTDWRCTSGCEFPVTIDMHLAWPMVLGSFAIGSNADAPERDPRVWEIQGSNDGVNFTTIFHRNQAPESASPWATRSQVLRFGGGVHYEEQAPFSIYRFVCYQTWSTEPGFQIGEIELFPCEGGLASMDRFEAFRSPDGATKICLRWGGRTGTRYTIERSEDLGSWTPVSTGLEGRGMGIISMFTDSRAETGGTPDKGAYYRIRTEPVVGFDGESRAVNLAD